MTDSAHHADPFSDPVGPIADATPSAIDPLGTFDVLTVDRNATLTLGTDALIVLDEGWRNQRAASNCCGLLPQLSKTTRAIPFYNVLWAQLTSFDVTIHYTQPSSSNSNSKSKRCAVACINYSISDKTRQPHAARWIERLLSKAYPAPTTRAKRIKVLINPFGGQGNAQKMWTADIEPIFKAARCVIDVERTAYRGHAVDIAEKIDVDAYDVIACASGDGVPHEVFNGLAKRADGQRALAKVAVVQLPCGSGNAMSWNLFGTDSPSLAAVAMVKSVRTSLDLVAITQGVNRYYSFLSQAVGIIAESDLGTESLRWMGPLRFTWGILVRLLGQTLYPAEIAVVLDSDDKRAIKDAYRRAVSEQMAGRAKLGNLEEQASSEDVSTTSASATATTDQQPPLKYGTVQDPLHPSFKVADAPDLGNFYVGNMCYMTADAPFFVTSLPSDGKMDMINISGLIARTTALRMLATSSDGSLMDFPEVSYRKVLAYRITPRAQPPPPARRRWRTKFGQWLGGAGRQSEGLIAIDGESVPFEPFQAEVVQGLGTVLSKRGPVYEFDGLLEH